MCNIFSGHIMTEKGKDWGKVIFLSGIHHEKDREQIKTEKIIAWESIKPCSLDEFKFSHDCGQNLTAKEKDSLMECLKNWAKEQTTEKLLSGMITVTKDNLKTEDYLIQENQIKTRDNTSIICDFTANMFSGSNSTQTAGSNSTQKAGWNSTSIIYGDTSSYILNGKNCTLIQKSDNETYVLKIDTLFEMYKFGDKLKIVKGKVIKED
jgi:hypothetical protein